MQQSDQMQLANRYGLPRAELLTSWVRTLNHARNLSAHHSRLWNRVSTEIPKMPRSTQLPTFTHLAVHRLGQNRPYAAAAIIQHFMEVICPNSEWSVRLKALCEEFPLGPGIEFRHTGFPPTWLDEALWK